MLSSLQSSRGGHGRLKKGGDLCKLGVGEQRGTLSYNHMPDSSLPPEEENWI